MSQKKVSLASDNWTPVHPLIIQAMIEANEGNAPAYGSDQWTEEAQKVIQEAFGGDMTTLLLQFSLYGKYR